MALRISRKFLQYRSALPYCFFMKMIPSRLNLVTDAQRNWYGRQKGEESIDGQSIQFGVVDDRILFEVLRRDVAPGLHIRTGMRRWFLTHAKTAG